MPSLPIWNFAPNPPPTYSQRTSYAFRPRPMKRETSSATTNVPWVDACTVALAPSCSTTMPWVSSAECVCTGVESSASSTWSAFS
ncbi:MAG: hypothetical protein U0575_02515 [Phycisphaerales bacterium]